MPLPDYYNTDLSIVKNMLKIQASDIEYDSQLEMALKEAFEDFNWWLRKKGINKESLPFAADDDDIKLIKLIEARGACGYYFENTWQQQRSPEGTGSQRFESDEKETNPHLAIYYRRRNSFWTGRFGKAGPNRVQYKRGSTIDADEPVEEEDD